eukprot:jgi/Chlat1/7894/Chrsp66S07203
MGGKRSREVDVQLEEEQGDMSEEEVMAAVDEEREEEGGDEEEEDKGQEEEEKLAGFSGRDEEYEDEAEVEEEQGPGVSVEEHNGEQPDTMKKKQRLYQLQLPEATALFQPALQQRGVIYLSRIPPFMKPLKLRHILSQYGEVLRIYLAPEGLHVTQDPRLRKKRKQAGGNSGKNFTEGWVEFADKGVAKRVASALNGQNIGGKRRSAYFYDLWNIKYLPKFKWDHLTEEIAYRNAVREQKLQAELSQAKKERDFYLAKVDQAHAIEAMEQRHSKQEGANGSLNEKAAARRTFVQRKPVPDPAADASRAVSEDVLAGVFGMGKAAKHKRQKEAGSI